MITPRLKTKYLKEIIPALQAHFDYTTPMRVPRLEKISLNIGLGKAVHNPNLLKKAHQQLAQITGQKPVTRRAKKSIANFKLREKMPIGVSNTLRGNLMYEFLDRLITLALPRVRDFRGISPTAFDKQGNYTLGIKEQVIFPEISIDKVDHITGMNITFVTNTKDAQETYQLLKAFGLPFSNTSKK